MRKKGGEWCTMCTLDPLGIILILSLNCSGINESYIEEMWRNHRGSLFSSRGVRCSVTVSFHPAHSDTMTHFWPHSCSLTHVHCCWLDVSEQEEVEVKSVVGVTDMATPATLLTYTPSKKQTSVNRTSSHLTLLTHTTAAEIKNHTKEKLSEKS